MLMPEHIKMARYILCFCIMAFDFANDEVAEL